MRRVAALVIALAVVAVAGAPARANSTTDCFWTVGRWGPARTTVNVWVSIDDFSGVQNLGVSIADAEMATRQAISIWNEQSGAALRMRYRGTSELGWVEGAVTIAYRPQQDPFGSAAARAWLVTYPSNPTQISHGSVVFYTGYVWDVGGGSDYQVFNPIEPTRVRLLPILVHELGHIAFQLTHPGQAGTPCTNLGQATVMSNLAYGLPTWPYRTLRAWDKTQAQLRMGRRSNYSMIIRRTWNAATSSWSAASSFTKYVLYRMGSTTQRPTDAVLGWVKQDEPGDPARVVRTDVVNAAGAFGPGQKLGIDTLSPVALASSPSGESIEAYLAYEDARNGLRYICYRTGSNSSFGSETCAKNAVTGAFWQTHRDTVTAAYDPRSKMFLISAIVEWGVDQNSKPLPRLWYHTVPTQGSTTPARSTLFASDKESFSAPSIACREARMGCRVFYQGRFPQGSLRWIEAEVDLATGYVTEGPLRTASLDQFDTPSVVWSQQENLYRVAFVQDNSVAHAYSLTATGTSLVALPPLATDGQFISAPVQSTTTSCGLPCAAKTSGWLVQWW